MVNQRPYLYWFYTRPATLTWSTIIASLQHLQGQWAWVCFDFSTATLIISIAHERCVCPEIRNRQSIMQRDTTEVVGCVPLDDEKWVTMVDAEQHKLLKPDLLAEIAHFIHQARFLWHSALDEGVVQLCHQDDEVWLRFHVGGCISLLDIYSLVGLYPMQLTPPTINLVQRHITWQWLKPDQRRLVWKAIPLPVLVPGLSQHLNMHIQDASLQPLQQSQSSQPSQPSQPPS
jgi:hypothetical protein